MTRTRQWLTVAAVAASLIAPSGALALPDFKIVLACETTTVVADSAPVSGSRTCGLGEFGSFQATAHASFGSVGAGTNASTFRIDAFGNAQADASFFDLITFTKTDPTAPDELLVSGNLDFGGILNAGATADFDAAATSGFAVSTGSVNLQRLDAAGQVTGTLGILRDNGLGGDAVAGDGLFTIRLTVTETLAGELRLGRGEGSPKV